MAANDFFLNFGSNAGPFASKLSDEIKPATESILGLIEALDDYEGTLAKARGANTPLNNLFGRLDQATAQFSELTGTLSQTFSKAIAGVTDLRADLSALVDEINKLPSARAGGRRQLAAAAASDTDVAVGQSRRQQKALADILEGNAITARNALKRVADINNTVSRAATGAADQLQILGKAIRDLRSEATQTRQGLGAGVGGGGVNLIFAGEGGIQNLGGAAGAANLQGLVDALTRTLGGSVGQVAAAATDAAADAAAVKVTKGIVPLSEQELDQPARPGRYSVLGGDSRPVGFDVRTERPSGTPETFREYFQRNDEVRQQVESIRRTLPQVSEDDLKAYNLFRSTGGRQSDEVFNRIVNSPTMSMEQVRASYPGLQLGALTPRQINDLPDILRRVNEGQQAQLTHAISGIEDLLRANPWATFQGGAQGAMDPTKEVGDVIGRAIRDVDERLLAGQLDLPAGVPGAEFRRNARETGAALRRIDYRSQYTGEYGDATISEARLQAPRTVSARMTEAKAQQERAQFDYDNAAQADREAAAIALQTANDNLAAVRREASEMRKAREQRRALQQQTIKAFEEGPRTPEQIRAQAERAPEVAQITARIRQLQESTGTAAGDEMVANLLGLPTTTERVDPGLRGQDLALRRERAQTQLEAFQADPAGYAERRRQQLLAEAESFRGSDLPKSREIAQEREAAAGQSIEQIEAGLRQVVDDINVAMREASTRIVRGGVGDPQRVEAVSRLETQREELIQQGIARLTAAGGIEPTTPAPVLQPREDVAGTVPIQQLLNAAEPGLIEQYLNNPEDRARIEELRGPVSRGETPPIEVIRDANRQLIEDGHHRLAAAHLEGMTEVAATVRRGSLRGQGNEEDPLASLEAMAARVQAPPRVEELRQQQADLREQIAAVRSQIEARGGFQAVRGMAEGPERDELLALREHFNQLKQEIRPVNQELHALSNAAAGAAQAEEKVAAAGGAGRGGTTPPRPPRPPAGGGTGGGGGDDGGDDEQEEQRRRRRASSTVPPSDYSGHIANLQDQTQADLQTLRAQLELTESTKALSAEQREAILQTAARYREDPAVQRMDAATRARTFSQAAGLSGMEGGNAYSRRVFGREGYLAADPRFANFQGAASSAEEAASAEEKYAQAEELATARTVAETNAILRLIAARERLSRVVANPNSTTGQTAMAMREVNSAEQALNKIRNSQDEQEGGILGRKLFGQRGFIDSQLRHFGQAIENIAGYTLVFSGFNQLREMVDTGIQADAAFTKLQGQLDATGRSTGALRAQLQGISSATAQSLPAVVEAASELTGVFSSNADLVQGTKIAAELANISQGTLTAKEAAIGLRDVTDAYGIHGASAIQQVGDEITRLSQVTGVSVKDVMEGTTQLAQEAHSFGLNQRQAAVLSAFVTRSTGETGESAAEQVSRILSTLNTGRVQTLLEKTRLPGTNQFVATAQQFAQGDIGDVLQNLLANFDKLSPSSQQAITALVGSGRQARAFAGLLRDASLAAKEFGNSQNDAGALAQQNKRFLDSLAGTIKSLETDFKNLGATLQQMGVFDILGIFAKTLDEVLKAFNSTFGAIGQFFNANPITKGLKDIIVLTGEAALAFKVFGGTIGTVLGKTIQPGRATVPVLSRAGRPVLDEATGEAMTQFAPYTFAEFRRNVASSPGALLRGVRRGFGSVADSSAQFFVPTRAAARYGVGEEELNAMSGGRARFRAVAQARLAQTVEADASATMMQRGMNVASVAMMGVGERARGFASAIRNIGTGMVSSMAAMLAFTYIVDRLVQALQSDSQLGKNENDIWSTLTGDTGAGSDAARHAGQAQDTTQSEKDVQTVQNQSNSFFHFIGNRLFHPGSDPGNVDPDVINGVHVNYSGNYTSIMNLAQKRLMDANKKPIQERAAALQKANEENQKDFQQFASDMKQMGYNKQQTAYIQNDIQGLVNSFTSSYQSLKAQADGIAKIDQLAPPLLDALQASLQQAGQYTSYTLAQNPDLAKFIMDQSGVPQESSAYGELQRSLGQRAVAVGPVAGRDQGTPGFIARLKAQVEGNQNIVKQTLEQLSGFTPSELADPNNQAVQQAKKRLDAATQAEQAAQQALNQAAVQNPQTLSTLAEQRGNNARAIKNLQTANKHIRDVASQYSKDDPQYIAYMKQIDDNKVKIAQLQAQTAVDAAQLAAAQTNDPLARAKDNLTAALAQQAAVAAEPGGGSQADRTQAAIGVAQAQIAKAQANADLKEAQFQQSISGHVQNAAQIQAQINDVLRQENLASSGTLASQQQLAQLKGQEAQLRAQQQQYAFDSYNAGLEEQIAVLQARGQGNDLVKAANIAVREAQRKVQQYLKKPGASKDDAEYKQLVGAVATAQRNAFDVALQAQLDTLDFEVATYKISSEAEIEGLRKILQEKNLTLKERRDIAMKIRQLQTSLSQELTGGGFNVPTEIHLPTAYQIRRSLGMGASGTQVITTTNNNQTVTVNNTVPTTALAVAVAKQVVSLINGSNASASRANAPTPPLVGG